MDITELILNDHHEQRRMFALLDDIDRADLEALGAVWTRLKILLEVHATAEERLFYPRVLDLGVGAGGKDSSAAETKDAIGDHNQIRDGIARAGRHQVGSDDWWAAIAAKLYPSADIRAESFAETRGIFVDAAIGNVPFADVVLHTQGATPAGTPSPTTS